MAVLSENDLFTSVLAINDLLFQLGLLDGPVKSLQKEVSLNPIEREQFF